MILPAKAEHLEALVSMFARAHREAPWAMPELNAEKIATVLANCIDQRTSCIAVEDEMIIGTICGRIGEIYFSDELVMYEVFTYVLPEYRSYKVISDMMAAMKNLATRKKMFLFAGQSYGYKVDATKNLYVKLGFQLIGFNAVYIPEEMRT